MTRSTSTSFGELLSAKSKKLVNEVRLKITQPIHPNFNNDFNIYRFVLACERVLKKEKEIIDSAAKTLNNHLRIRKALNLDDLPDLPFDENPLFSQRLLPLGHVLNATDSCNRLLWYVEYKSINVETLAHVLRSSESMRLQIRQFEHMLKRVNQQEEKTGRLSGIRHIVDMNGFEINPFTMVFATNGTLTYYSQTLHFENYPELVNPLEMVNISKWIHVPYKIARTMMPDGFTERFRLHDGNFLPILMKDIKAEDIPTTLGGTNEEIKCQPALKRTPDQYFTPKDFELLSTLETIIISPRKRRLIHVDVKESGKKLQWYFSTDGDIYFGVFYESPEQIKPMDDMIHVTRQEKEIDCDELEMVYPWFKSGAKLVHEMDSMECKRPGHYWFVICNKGSWVNRRTINLIIQLVDKDNGTAKRCHSDGTFSTGLKPFATDSLY